MKKNYCLILILLTALSSCVPKQLISVSSGHDASVTDRGNFILFKSGREMRLPDDLDVKSGLLNMDKARKIKVGNNKYAAKDIQSIQINEEYFVNIGKKEFVKRIYHGPLNVFNRYKTSTSTSYNGAGGGWSSSTTVSTEYFVQKDSVKKGDILKVSGFGSSKKLMPFVSDYKPSKEILEKYEKQRRISRIVKFSVAGLWASSLPVFMTSKSGSTLESVSGSTFFLGMVAVPLFTFTFKYGNHKRPYKAVQSYIDNNFYKESLAGSKAKKDDTTDAMSNVLVNASSSDKSSKGSIISDYIVLNDTQIVAKPGTKLQVANNKIFSINDQKYSSGITAYQLRKKFYKKIPGSESDFGQRIVTGRINVYKMTKQSFSKNGSSHVANKNGFSFAGATDKKYYEKEGEGPMERNPMKIGSYFKDNTPSMLKYNAFARHVRTTKLVSYGLSAITLGTGAAVIAKMLSKDISSNYRPSKDPLSYVCTGSGIFNLVFTINHAKKLEPEILSVVKGYNKTKSF